MQKVKYFLGTIGAENPGYGVKSAEQVEADLGFKYLSDGWTVESSHYLGAIRDDVGNDIGYKIFHVLVKNEEIAEAKAKK